MLLIHDPLFDIFVSNAVLLCVDRNVFHKDQFVRVSHAVTLKCNVSNSHRVLWDFRRSVEQDVGNVYDRRLINEYQRRCTIDNSTYDLTICEAEIDDTGEYWCIHDAGFGTNHITKLYVTGIEQLQLL